MAKNTKSAPKTSAKAKAKPAAAEKPAKAAVAAAPTSFAGVVVPEGKRTVLHVGCGKARGITKDKLFADGDWHEIRLDIDPDVQPDIVADMRNMSNIPEGSVDAVWSSHNIEHVYPHEVAGVIAEFFRVLKPSGFLNIATPDLQTVCEPVAQGKIDETLYVSPAGPITPIDILYGHRRSLSAGRIYMAHHCGFTAVSLGKIMHAAGFFNIHMQRNGYHLYGYGEKISADNVNKQTGIRISNLNAPRQQVPGQPAMPVGVPQQPGKGLPDELDRAPLVWEAS